MNEKVNGFNIKFKAFLNDKELLGDIRTGVAITLALLLPLAWFGLFANIDIYALLNYTVGGLVLFVVASMIISWIEISIKAKRDEIEDNTELKATMQSKYDKQLGLPKIDRPMLIDAIAKIFCFDFFDLSNFFFATPTNEGGSPNYEFFKNGSSVQNGSSATYTTSSLVNSLKGIKSVISSFA